MKLKNLFAAIAFAVAPVSLEATEIRVLTLNVQTDGSGGRIPGLVDLIRRSGANVVGLQEWGKNAAPDGAKALGFNFRKLNDDTALLSRFPIGTRPSRSLLGAPIVLEDGRTMMVYSLHLFYKPYQPYQLLGIPYEGGRFIKTEEEAIDEARKARGADIDKAVSELAGVKTPVILVGDFNEPSYLDWTQATADAKRHPLKVAWPATFAFAKVGLRDSYRVVYPDEMAKPGYTWTPTTRPDDPKDHHDRIDFVLFRGDGLHVRHVQIVGENAENADIVISPYPTDHRGVLATFDY